MLKALLFQLKSTWRIIVMFTNLKYKICPKHTGLKCRKYEIALWGFWYLSYSKATLNVTTKLKFCINVAISGFSYDYFRFDKSDWRWHPLYCHPRSFTFSLFKTYKVTFKRKEYKEIVFVYSLTSYVIRY